MKNYFDFTLTGKKLLPVWLFYYFLILVPYSMVMIFLHSHKTTSHFGWFYLIMIWLMIAGTLIGYFFIKLSLENIIYKGKQVAFKGKFRTFSGKVIVGIVLTIISLGIYVCWFIEDITRYIAGNTSLDSSEFRFLGKGVRLFLIISLTLMVPMIIFIILITTFTLANHPGTSLTLYTQLLIYFLMIPYVYFSYKWFMNIRYRNYLIRWETYFFKSVLKILLEIFLTIITLGIYSPLAFLKIYKYFIDRTAAVSDTETRRFGYDIDIGFHLLWGQILLTIVTLGIYYPWAYVKIGKRILNKTYLKDAEVVSIVQ